ncbi:AraC family transcriptional regulator [Nocardioides zeicaulis]|uniref:Helix-turn-helix domain-containing protein n=1 Tax=Nocardioides zeicaulis TaxID=1776857 RepID=A0ABV6E2R8_9ACTN
MQDPRASHRPTATFDFEGTGDAARHWLDQAYGSSLGLRGPMGQVRHRRTSTDGIDVDHLLVDAPLTFDAEPLPALVVVDVLHGGIEYTRSGATDQAVDGDTLLASGWGLPFRGSGQGYEVRNTSVSVEMLDAAIRDIDPDRTADDLAFERFVPHSPEAGARWRATLDEFRASAPVDDAPLLRGSASRLLTYTLLHTFPNNIVRGTESGDVGRDRRDASQSTVRRAQAFIEGRAADDLSVADIAAAAGVTPRSLQYAFQQHLGCTPLAYLRRVRLDLVHRSLRTGTVEAVSDAAVRMGFFNPGRFAAEYRKIYGENPRDTLRRATS